MALKDGARDWLDAASARALAEVHRALERMMLELAELRADAVQQRSDVDGLRGDLAVLADRLETCVDTDALATLASRLNDVDKTNESLRLRIAGQSEQMRWESDDLRKAFAAIAERIERKA
jgi:hypothetical protein